MRERGFYLFVVSWMKLSPPRGFNEPAGAARTARFVVRSGIRKRARSGVNKTGIQSLRVRITSSPHDSLRSTCNACDIDVKQLSSK
jgi:hypothetical protein